MSVSTLAAFVRDRLIEEEQIIREVSRWEHSEEPGLPEPQHWHWECYEHDQVIVPDPLTQDHLECDRECFTIGLRSVETYESGMGGELPSMHLHSEEVRAILAVYIARYDPARMMAEIESKRALLNAAVEVLDDGGAEGSWAEFVLSAMASVWREHPAYDQRWGA